MDKLVQQILDAGVHLVKTESDTTMNGSYRHLQYVRALTELLDLLRAYREATK